MVNQIRAKRDLRTATVVYVQVSLLIITHVRGQDYTLVDFLTFSESVKLLANALTLLPRHDCVEC